jgi:hypothetical protein
MSTNGDIIIKKKRGRKPKKKVEPTEEKIPKKRGRKPRGGKIVSKTTDLTNVKQDLETNIILHLKCNTKQLDKQGASLLNNKYNPKISQPDPFSLKANQKLNSLTFENIGSLDSTPASVNFEKEQFKTPSLKPTCGNSCKENHDTDDVNIKEVWKKLSNLQYQLHYNCLPDKRSSCFWCTCEFDNPTIYIPSKINKGVYDVYGCFCSPQCAVAFLRNEPLDHSVLWERYSMINDLYGKIFGINIKPAPSPYYTLTKYYGNLTIQEYRKLLNNDKLLMVVDKPMSKVLPELHEDNNELPNVNNNLLSHQMPALQNSSNYRLKSNNLKHEKRSIFS